jgi:hypothetical protein
VLRRARPDRAAIGLGRQPRSDQDAFCRIDPDFAVWAGLAAFALTRTQPEPRTLSLAAIRSRPVKGGVVASNYLTLPRDRLAAAPGNDEKDASHRRLQPTYDTSTLRTDRFSSAPPSSLAALWSAHPRRRPRPPADDPSGATLDGEPPASALLRPPSALRGRSLGDDVGRSIARSWRVPRSTAPPSDASRPRCFRPRAELAT